jgi:hypothetical protein
LLSKGRVNLWRLAVLNGISIHGVMIYFIHKTRYCLLFLAWNFSVALPNTTIVELANLARAKTAMSAPLPGCCLQVANYTPISPRVAATSRSTRYDRRFADQTRCRDHTT